MSRWIFVLMLASLIAARSFAASTLTIQAKQQTTDRRQSQSQRLPRGATSLAVSEVCYLFTFKPTSLQPPASSEAQWVVLVEGVGGRLHVGTTGKRAIAFGGSSRQGEVRTDAMTLSSREWRGARRQGTVGESIYGYAVRVVDDKGAVLAEKYEPGKLKDRVDWDHPEASGDQPAPGAEKPINQPLQVQRMQ